MRAYYWEHQKRVKGVFFAVIHYESFSKCKLLSPVGNCVIFPFVSLTLLSAVLFTYQGNQQVVRERTPPAIYGCRALSRGPSRLVSNLIYSADLQLAQAMAGPSRRSGDGKRKRARHLLHQLHPSSFFPLPGSSLAVAVFPPHKSTALAGQPFSTASALARF